METNVIEYYCVTCDAGPWGQNVKGSDDRLIYQIHVEQGHKVEIFNKKNHESLKSGVKVGVSDFKNTESEVDMALRKASRLESIIDKGYGDNTSDFVMREMTSLLIEVRHMVSIIEIGIEIKSWCKRFGVNDVDYDIITDVINDPNIFPIVREICFQKGRKKELIIFDKSQLTEASYWLMGRYYIKRIDLTGDLLFFNDQYYERDAEALIRRNARKLFNKTKNNDINEIVKLIQDSCNVIKWKNIENSINKKCLMNGTYDIDSGVFVEGFDPENIIVNQIPHSYNPIEKWGEIEKVVKTILVDDNDRQSFYDSISNSLRPFTGIDFQFGGVGQPGTGKSQLCELTSLVLGEENVGGAKIHDIAEDPTVQKDMAFKMMNIDDDLDSSTFEHIDVLKKWITQDMFTARSIYEHSTTFRPQARLMFMANDLFEIPNPDDAEAIYERTHIIRIENKFRGENGQVTQIMRKTATDEQLDGFITYLLNNAHEITKNEKIHHPMNFSTVRDTWNTFGNRVKAFCEKWLVYDAGEKVESLDVWAKWVAHAQQNNFKAKSKKKFYPIIEEITGSTPTKTRIEDSQVYAFHGFRLKTDYELEQEEKTFLTEPEREEKSKEFILSVLQGIVENMK